MKIVLMEHKPDYKAIYGLNLTVFLGSQIVTAKTIREILLAVDEQHVDLVFINNNSYTRDVANELWKEFQERELKVELFVVGDSEVPQAYVTVFDANIQLRDILQSIAKLMKVTAKDMVELVKEKHYALPMEFIIPGWQTNVEIFKKDGSNYISIFKPEDIIKSDNIEAMEGVGLDQLYILSKDRLTFANFITIQISGKLNAPNLSPQERHQVTGVAYEMVMEQARQIGINETTMKLADDAIASIGAGIKDIKKLDDLLGNLLSSKGTYRYKQSFLINFIGTHILKALKWASKDQLESFAFVSFFHNIVLFKDKYVQVRSNEELENRGDLNDREKELISKHALAAARLVSSSVEKIPYEAAIIIKQHHGVTDGIGFNRVSGKISPLALIFVVAEEWATHVLKYEVESSRPTREQLVQIIKEKYRHPEYDKIMPALDKLTF